MSVDATAPRSRRSLLSAAAATAAATAAALVSRPLDALADTGDPLVVGQQNAASDPTQLDGRLLVNSAAGSQSDQSDIALRVSSFYGTGVVGETSGEWGQATTGVRGVANSPFGVAVAAIGQHGGTGLYVQGKVQITSRSGRATVAAGKSYVDVDLRFKGNVTGIPLCFGSLMSYRPGVFVTMVRANVPSGGWIRINLNRKVNSKTNVAWLVLN